jgi:predicted alpha/beta-fold hydrolase
LHRILDKAKPDAGDGRFEHFKTTQAFDDVIYRRMHGFPGAD